MWRVASLMLKAGPRCNKANKAKASGCMESLPEVLSLYKLKNFMIKHMVCTVKSRPPPNRWRGVK